MSLMGPKWSFRGISGFLMHDVESIQVLELKSDLTNNSVQFAVDFLNSCLTTNFVECLLMYFNIS